MSATVEFFRNEKPIRWKWPLQIRLVDADRALTESLKGKYWFSNFTTLSSGSSVSRHDGPDNIIFFPSGFQKACELIRDSGFECDVILIQETSDFFTEPFESSQYYDLLNEISESTGASGIFIFSTARDLASWFDDLLIRLSHDQNLVGALSESTRAGYFFIDPKLTKETRLTTIFKGLIDGLRKISLGSDDVISLDSGITGAKVMKAADWADYLESLSHHFTFQHESAEANSVAQIARGLYDKFDPKMFQQNVSDVDELPKISRSVSSALLSDLDFMKEITLTDEWNFPLGGLPDDYSSDKMADSSGDNAGGVQMADVFSMQREATAPAPEETSAARYLQAMIHDVVAGSAAITKNLVTNSVYKIVTRIGIAEAEWLFDKTAAVADDLIFTTPAQKSETIHIMFRSNLDNRVQTSQIELPRSGNSSKAEFLIIITGGFDEFRGELMAFHKNRLLQTLEITARIFTPAQTPPADLKITSRITFCLKKALNNLDQQNGFGTSFVYDADDKQNGMLGVADNEPVDLFFSSGLQDILDEIKKDIENTVVNIDKFPESLDDKNNLKLLIRLALKGNSIYVNHLKENTNLKGPIQIVSKRPGFVPLEFVYTFPPPALDAKLCPNALKALAGESCETCFDKTVSPAPYVCPMGFWCFSEVIERHSQTGDGDGDYSLTAESGYEMGTLGILKNTLFASSAKVEATVDGLRARVASEIRKSSPILHEAGSWAEWKTVTESEKPDCMIMIVHTELNKDYNVEQLELGDGDFQIQNYLDATVVKSKNAIQPPLMIVLGCETADLSKPGFDISAQLINKGAAIVISNFTKIRGRQAGPIVIKLVEFLKEHSGSEISLGEILLKLRKYLLANGIMVGLALTAQGDADWKIKS